MKHQKKKKARDEKNRQKTRAYGQKKIKCEICDKLIRSDGMAAHKRTKSHLKKLMEKGEVTII